MLYIIATPIGNLKDISLRALEVLTKADLILTEDTRRGGLFLKGLNLPKKPFLSFYEHNEIKRIPQIIRLLKQGKEVVLLSQAGSPLISDPGLKLVRKCIEEGVPFTSLPGPSAVINAVILSGLASDSFLFLGFLPRKKGKRIRKIRELKKFPYTLVIFESPQRIEEALKELRAILGERRVCICREMTKIYEEVLRGDISQLINSLSKRKIKGECTLVIEGAKDKQKV
ncbi:MAG: 16S rRNA (cytidine(1402)-2'-O)-methyltransferase [Candidatus Duberdicusella sinuisediminis]|nr:MAG: 16S rRNA (cytidine(1402)-2'-O)-methyltransferase [Candidatus Omnitrophota bacterium]